MTQQGMASQRWDPEQYARNARFVSDLGEPVVDLLAPESGERILDLGCGDGALTEKLVAAGCHVVAVDSSSEQIKAARGRGLDAHVGKAEELTFTHEFDAVFSNATLHWIHNADEVIAKVFRALRPGGRFVGEFGGAGCVQAIRNALTQALQARGVETKDLNPWFFPTAEEYQERLQRQGFTVEWVSLFPRPTVLPGDIAGWLETFGQRFLNLLPDTARQDAIDEVRTELLPHLYDPNKGWVADYVRLRFAARRLARHHL